MPEANRFMFHVMAAVAEQEGKAISERTKAALEAAKARGVKLGMANPVIARHRPQAVARSVATRTAQADDYAANTLPVIRSIAEGGASLRQIASALNSRGIKTARGGAWYATSVKNILDRGQNQIELEQA